MRYKVLEADPPWKFGDKLPGPGRSAAKHYGTMAVEEIMRYGLPPLDDDCVLFLWRVSAMQQQALDVLRAWGFRPHSEIVWRKTTKNGKQHMGMGRIVRGAHETCLIGVRGRPKPLVRNVRSVFDAPVGIHSAKPSEFYEIVESLFPGPYVRLFARDERRCWTSYINEEPKP